MALNLVLASAGGMIATQGCGDGAHAADDGGATGVIGPPNALDAGVDPAEDADVNVDAGPPVPPALPLDGWVAYPDYLPACLLYVPSSLAAIGIAPLTWSACPAITMLGGLSCKALDRLPGYPAGYAIAETENGELTIVTTMVRADFSDSIFLAQRLDGAIRWAFRARDMGKCQVELPSSGGAGAGKYVLHVYDNRKPSSSGPGSDGFIAGALDDLRPSFARPDEIILVGNNVVPHDYSAISAGVYEGRGSLYDWATHAKSSAPSSFGVQEAMARRFYQQDGTILVEAVDGGAAPFLAGDAMNQMNDFGTDGTQMVWLQGPPGMTGGPPQNIMVAPFTPDPPQIAAKRLRSEIWNGATGFPAHVGCGRAAHSTGEGIRVIDLANGNSWLLANSTASGGVYWSDIVALTCSELFADLVVANKTPFTVRIGLSSLGPPTPPD